MTEDASQRFEIDLPSDAVGGTYADFASVWHTPNIFVMDFLAVSQPPKDQVDPETGTPQRVVPARVVSRIRIPPEQVFELAKALTKQLEFWERETGRRANG